MTSGWPGITGCCPYGRICWTKAGDTAGAYEHYRRAAKATAGIAEQRYLESRAGRLRA
ncbi:hypothetical protein GCM10022419_114370 [Nonomuraea rosea]|uniref:Uncharacterized protein n=1 Tax=Nonomuraea rosea TaxID=638574 RepID=A0ABP6ZI83_9ACTN